MKQLCIQMLAVLFLFASCGRNKGKETIIENSMIQDSIETVSSEYPPIIYDKDSIPVFYMGQHVYSMEGEVPATFMGGPFLDTFKDHVFQQLSESEVKAKPGTRGLVIVKFIVDNTGEVSFARAVLADDTEIEAEAIRIIKSSPKWEPATMNGKDVNMVLGWTFRFPH